MRSQGKDTEIGGFQKVGFLLTSSDSVITRKLKCYRNFVEVLFSNHSKWDVTFDDL